MKSKIGIIGYGWVARANHRKSYALANNADLAVSIEKPVGINAQEAAAVRDLAEKRYVTLAEIQQGLK